MKRNAFNLKLKEDTPIIPKISFKTITYFLVIYWNMLMTRLRRKMVLFLPSIPYFHYSTFSQEFLQASRIFERTDSIRSCMKVLALFVKTKLFRLLLGLGGCSFLGNNVDRILTDKEGHVSAFKIKTSKNYEWWYHLHSRVFTER